MNNKQEQQYIDLLNKVTNEGCKKQLKYGDKVLDEYCLSLFGESLKFDCRDWTLPLYTHRKINWELGLKEMLWFIQGDGDLVSLHKSGVKFWDEWGVKYHNQKYKTDWDLKKYRIEIKEGRLTYLELPLHYTNSTTLFVTTNTGYSIENDCLNQTKWVIDTLLKNPNARHCVVQYWRPEDTYEMAKELDRESVILPACHFSYVVNINNDLVCLNVQQRSADLVLGTPTNVSQYAFLLFMYAKCLNKQPGFLKVDITDAHIYSNQIELIKKNIFDSKLYTFPKVQIKNNEYKYLEDFKFEDFKVVNYQYDKEYYFPLTVVGGF